jgi:hypothetical protein
MLHSLISHSWFIVHLALVLHPAYVTEKAGVNLGLNKNYFNQK